MNNHTEFSTLNAQQQVSLDKHRELINEFTTYNTHMAENRFAGKPAPQNRRNPILTAIMSVFRG